MASNLLSRNTIDSSLSERISDIKEEKNGVLLAHNYQIPEIQEEADYLGDSLGLARKSAETDADIIVFAGVDFMAETAAILNPDKKVLLPDQEARCPMAAMLTGEDVRKAKASHPDAATVLYVNTLAESRAEADIICTSSNCVQIVKSLPEDEILLGPDRNIAWYSEQNTEKEIVPIPEDGFCYVHRMFSEDDVRLLKRDHPEAEVLVHPEADPGVQGVADYICSTSQMLDRAKNSPSEKFIVATEVGLIQRMRREIPDKEFLPALEEGICEQMKKHTLEKVYRSFCDEKFEVEVSSEIAERVKKATERMFEVSD